MFESVLSGAVHREGRARFFGTFSVSMIVHGIALSAMPLATAWKVTFPTEAPTMMALYSLVEPPPPPPPAAPPKPKQVVQVLEKAEVRQPSVENLAPTIIPDAIPVVTAPVLDSGVEGGVEGGVDSGVVGGVTGGTPEGLTGGKLQGEGAVAVPVIPPVDEDRVVVPRDAVLRMSALSKTVPTYPERARLQGWEDQNVVRYVIGKDGRVKEVTILDPADRKIFDEATINAIRHWRFRPMIKDGEAKEVVHELTIRYRLMV